MFISDVYFNNYLIVECLFSEYFATDCSLYGFYPRDAMLERVIAIATCLSVCLSRAGIVYKTKKASGMISSPSGSPKTLVF